ncbi:MAG: isoprenylcysteine carboxylmethyltransferase family protein [Lachnospiraceae bacterium]|nr:isoprenylcysteine carboxylmethyltransferase family protein [Lachnospiraceae bacterium]
MKKQDHLPMCGVGPVYGAVIILLTVLGIRLTRAGIVPAARYGIFRIPLAIVGIILILLGTWMWYSAVFRAKVEEHITGNTLATTGIYAWVRNPIYSAFLLACTGALLLANNLWLLILPVVFWLYLTVLMKCTEEKWLAALHGEKYADYCRQVNRCIPWPPKAGKDMKWH